MKTLEQSSLLLLGVHIVIKFAKVLYDLNLNLNTKQQHDFHDPQ